MSLVQTDNIQNSDNINRRDFFKNSAATIAVTSLASGVTLTAFAASNQTDDIGVSNEQRWGMLIDTDKCADGCTACVSACSDENGWGKTEKHSNALQQPEWIRKVQVKDTTTKKVTNLVLMCQHCEQPPCVDVCPTNASIKRADGIVLVDSHRCIGCRYCMLACPYDARSFVHEAISDQKPYRPRGIGTVESCTLCVHKVDNDDGTTACADACKKEGHEAILFGDLYDTNSEISKRLKQYPSTQIRADLGLNTGVRYTSI